MRALQYFPTIEDPNARRALFEVQPFNFCTAPVQKCMKYNDIVVTLQVLQRILMGTDVVKNVNKNNASHAVLFEALALVSLY